MKTKVKTKVKTAVKTKVKTKVKTRVKTEAPPVPVEKVVVVKDVSFTDEQLKKMEAFGTDILMPKLSYRFRAEFLDESALVPLPENNRLNLQLVRIDDVSTTMYSNKMELHFQDDVANAAHKALDTLRNRLFTIKIMYLGTDHRGDEAVIRTHYVKHVRIVDVLYGPLDYADPKPLVIKAVVSYSVIAVL